jgi:hypothetical protein
MADKRNVFDEEVRLGPIKEAYLTKRSQICFLYRPSPYLLVKYASFIGPNLTSSSNTFLLSAITLSLSQMVSFIGPYLTS